MQNSHKIQSILIIFVIIVITITGCSGKSKSDTPQYDVGSGNYVARINMRNFGAVDLRLFGSSAPDAVNSFVKLAASGCYDNMPIQSVIEDYCLILKGSNSSDFATEDSHNDSFYDEMKETYYPFNGAVCLTDSSIPLSAESFMLINNSPAFISELEELLAYKGVTLAEYCKQAYGTDLSPEQVELFRKYGGAPWLYGHCIVFGQVYSGFEVLENISLSEVSNDGAFTPIEELIVDSIEVISSQ